jgi:hypothetical protein
MSKPAFKIGQSLLYRKDRVKMSGRYVVLAVFPQTRGEVRYRVRSQDDESREMNCAFHDDGSGGTAAGLAANDCIMTITAKRAAELEYLVPNQ